MQGGDFRDKCHRNVLKYSLASGVCAASTKGVSQTRSVQWLWRQPPSDLSVWARLTLPQSKNTKAKNIHKYILKDVAWYSM